MTRLSPLLLVVPCITLAGCPPTTLVGQPCSTAGENQCEGDGLLRCDGQFYRLLAECATECVAKSGRAPTEHKEAILSADETWQCAEGPHLVGTTITVAAGVTLTLEAGALLRMAPASRINADPQGRIDALGTTEASILMTSDDELKGSYGAGAEGGLNVFAVESGEPSRIEHTIIERGRHGLGVFGLSATAAPPVVEGNTFRDNQNYGILVRCNGTPEIPDFAATNNFFTNDAGDVSTCQE